MQTIFIFFILFSFFLLASTNGVVSYSTSKQTELKLLQHLKLNRILWVFQRSCTFWYFNTARATYRSKHFQNFVIMLSGLYTKIIHKDYTQRLYTKITSMYGVVWGAFDRFLNWLTKVHMTLRISNEHFSCRMEIKFYGNYYHFWKVYLLKGIK